MEMILTPVLCLVFWRNHLFAALLYTVILYLMLKNMTVMVFPSHSYLLVLSVSVFLCLFIMEISSPHVKEIRNKSKILFILSIIRFPINWAYLDDFAFRLRHWHPIVQDFDQPSIGAVKGTLLNIPVILVLILSLWLAYIYIQEEQKHMKNKEEIP